MAAPMHRIYLAFLCFFRILFGRALPPELIAAPPRELQAAEPPKPLPEPPPKKKIDKVDPAASALQLLALLQREGRLVDFLSEEIAAYEDAAIGAAVRDIHKGCKKVLVEHFGVEPVLAAEEDEAVTVDTGFDPAKIRLVGNVSGAGPFKGTLRHHGWRAARVSMPALADGMDATIVAPAEVELA